MFPETGSRVMWYFLGILGSSIWAFSMHNIASSSSGSGDIWKDPFSEEYIVALYRLVTCFLARRNASARISLSRPLVLWDLQRYFSPDHSLPICWKKFRAAEMRAKGYGNRTRSSKAVSKNAFSAISLMASSNSKATAVISVESEMPDFSSWAT